MESLTGLAPARTVRETVGLLLSDSDKDGQRIGVGWRLPAKLELPCKHHLREQCAGALTRRLAVASSGHAMSCSRSLVETACCFANWVAPGSLP